MRARPLCLLALLALAPALAACGAVSISSSEATGSQLAVYSSLPLQGPAAARSQQIVNGEKLALAHSGGRIGPFTISFVSLNDANPGTGHLDPGATAANAKTAAQDVSTIAYLGDYSSASTAVSLPLINAAGILQVSPASPYVGLTSSLYAGQDEPQRFYPSGRRNFGRLQPGDPAQAVAQARLMRLLGVRKVYVLDDQDAFQIPLAQLAAREAQRAGVVVAAHDSIATSAGSVFTGEVEKIVSSGAQAVLLAGGGEGGAATLWRKLQAADPRLLLLGTSSLVERSFLSAIGPAAARTYLTTPALAPDRYPPSAARILSEYRRRFGGAPGVDALYGYEAMSVVLDAIRSAGAHGNARRSVIDRFFAPHDRDSVLGHYSMQANGETTLSPYGVDRVSEGRAVFYTAVPVP